MMKSIASIVRPALLTLVFGCLSVTLAAAHDAPLTGQQLYSTTRSADALSVVPANPPRDGDLRFATEPAADGMVDDFEDGIWAGLDKNNDGLGFMSWGDAHENVNLAVRQIIPYSLLSLPGEEAQTSDVLAVAYDVTAWGGFTHIFTDGTNWITQDWSAYDGFSFWLYGNGTRGIVYIDLYNNHNPNLSGDTAERWTYPVEDDYTGWRQFTIPFTLFQRATDSQPQGAPDDGLGLAEMSGYAFGFPAGIGAQVAYLDDVRLVNGADTAAVVTLGGLSLDTTADANSVTEASHNWVLKWSDEFEGSAGTPINSANWTAVLGGDSTGGTEQQYYTDLPGNASLDGQGDLALVARQENPGAYACSYGDCTYTSARITSKDKFQFTYGRVEARIRIPSGQGLWPAFWMLGSDIDSVGWPASGEIDVLENVGKEPNTAYGTAHGTGYSGPNGVSTPYTADKPLSDDFHVYAVEWEPDVIRWYVDDVLYKTFRRQDVNGLDWPFDKNFYLLLNVAVGGYWPGNPDATTQFPQTMLVDYVRVYQAPPASN